MRFLTHLLDILLPPRKSEALVREATLETIGTLVIPQIVEGAGATALLPYREPSVRALIVEAKYRDSKHAQELLGSILRDYLEQLVEDGQTLSGKKFVLVPIPLGARRLRSRGYNQVEQVCHMALRSPLREVSLAPELLERTRETLPQTSLPKGARSQNLQNAFHAVAPLDNAHTYIVVDDVVTTGATLKADRDGLRQAGASSVQLLALAH